MESYTQEDPNQILAEMEQLLDDQIYDSIESHSTINGSTIGDRVTNYE